MRKPFDHTKPCRTRDGREVREVLRLEHPLSSGEVFVAVIEGYIRAFFEDGRFDRNRDETGTDLINIPEKVTVEAWAVVMDGRISLFTTHDAAKGCADSRLRVEAIVHLTGEYER